MLMPDFGLRMLGSFARNFAMQALVIVLVPPAAVGLGVLAVFEKLLPQPAGRGPVRRDEF